MLYVKPKLVNKRKNPNRSRTRTRQKRPQHSISSLKNTPNPINLSSNTYRSSSLSSLQPTTTLTPSHFVSPRQRLTLPTLNSIISPHLSSLSTHLSLSSLNISRTQTSSVSSLTPQSYLPTSFCLPQSHLPSHPNVTPQIKKYMATHRISIFHTSTRYFAGNNQNDKGDTDEKKRKKPTPPSREQIYRQSAQDDLYDSRDRTPFPPKSLDSLDDVVQRRYGPGLGPYAPFHEGLQHEMSANSGIMYDHTLPKGPKPYRWSFPPDAPAPQGYKKYEARDGTWWRGEEEKSDHEPYQMPHHDYEIPDYMKRLDRRKKFYTYMHRNPADHIHHGPTTPSYVSQRWWFWTNRIFDKIDVVTRVVIHMTRPIWILTKIMFRIPEFTIKFILQLKVEVFRYIEKRWGPPEKRDPYVYKFIPGMLDALFNGSSVMSDYIERWGVRDPDVGAALRKYHVLDFNHFIMNKAGAKLEQIKNEHYQAFLDNKKKNQEKAFKKSPTYRFQQIDKSLKNIIGTHDYTKVTGLTPGDKFYGKSWAEMQSELGSRIKVTDAEQHELYEIQTLFKKNKCIRITAHDLVQMRFSLKLTQHNPFANLVDRVVEKVKQLERVNEGAQHAYQQILQEQKKTQQETPQTSTSSNFSFFMKPISTMFKRKHVFPPSLHEMLSKHLDLLETIVKDNPAKVEVLNQVRQRENVPKPQIQTSEIAETPSQNSQDFNSSNQSSSLPSTPNTATNEASFYIPPPPSKATTSEASFYIPPDSTTSFAMPASSPSANSTTTFAMPASSSSTAFAMPASSSSTAFAMPASSTSSSNTAFAMPASSTSSSNTAFAMPASSSTAFAMPASSDNSSAGFAIIVDSPPPVPKSPPPSKPQSDGNNNGPGIIML